MSWKCVRNYLSYLTTVASGLSANCCIVTLLYLFFSPTAENITLTCCGAPIEESCSANPACAEMGLVGACCPTSDGFGFLDCCSGLPDECISHSKQSGSSGSADCNLKSAEEYLAVLNSKQSGASSLFGSLYFTAWAILLVGSGSALL